MRARIRAVVNAPRRLFLATLAVYVVCSAAYSVIEHKGPIQGLWWGIVTGSTVGYGDFYPESTAGRFVAVVLIVSMLVMVPILIGHVIAGFVVDRNEFTDEEQREMLTLLRRIDANLIVLAGDTADDHREMHRAMHGAMQPPTTPERPTDSPT